MRVSAFDATALQALANRSRNPPMNRKPKPFKRREPINVNMWD